MAEIWDDLEEWEEWDPNSGTKFWVHAFAGSLAGSAEHCLIFPIDTIKTHAQASGSSAKALKKIVKREGPQRLWRGVSTMLTACIPAHAVYFSLFEHCKERFGADQDDIHTPLAAGAAGAIATVAHDSIMTPFECVKQRLQLGFYSNMVDCARQIIRYEGASALFIALPTTLAMNIPFAGIMVATNESMKTVLNPSGEYNVGAFFVSGGVAGGVAAALTTPLDVVKTRLQTQAILIDSCPPQSPNGAAAMPSTSASSPARVTSFLSRGLFSPLGMLTSRTTGFAIAPYYSRAGRGGVRVNTVGSVGAKGTTTLLVRPKLNSRPHSTGGPPHHHIKYSGFKDAATQIYKEEGWRGFTRGLRPRMMVYAPSVAISWTTYETAKTFLINTFPNATTTVPPAIS